MQPIVPSYRLRIPSDEQLERLKSNTFVILEEIGFHCPSERALEVYAEHGAVVDTDTQIVELSPDLILEAYPVWVRSGKKDALVLAKERMEQILATHKPEPLMPDQEQAVEEILKGARGFYRKKGLLSDEEWSTYTRR